MKSITYKKYYSICYIHYSISNFTYAIFFKNRSLVLYHQSMRFKSGIEFLRNMCLIHKKMMKGKVAAKFSMNNLIYALVIFTISNIRCSPFQHVMFIKIQFHNSLLSLNQGSTYSLSLLNSRMRNKLNFI